jgi:hypothetical protein
VRGDAQGLLSAMTCRSPATGFGHRNFNLRFEIVQRRSGALQMSFSSICADRLSLVTARIVGAHDGHLAGHGRATATILFPPCASARLIVEVEKQL